MGNADLKVTVGLLLLGGVLGTMVLKLSSPPAPQAPGRHGQALTAPHVAPVAGANSDRVAAASAQSQGVSSPKPAPTGEPATPPAGAISEPLFAVEGKILAIDPERRVIEVGLVTPAAEGSPERVAQRPAGGQVVKKSVELSEATRIEQVISGKGRQGEPPPTPTWHRLNVDDLQVGDVVRCLYRSQTPDTLQGVERISRLIEMEIDAYFDSEGYNTWLAKQPTYVKGRIVSIDPAHQVIDFQGYVFNQAPPHLPRQQVALRPGAGIYQIEEESQADRAHERRSLEQLRAGQTILFPAPRDVIQENPQRYDADRIIVVERRALTR